MNLPDDKTLGSLASPSNLRLGTEIFEDGGVEIIEESGDKISAHVGGSKTQPRNAWLENKGGELSWHCSCIRQKRRSYFCKHLVAVVKAARQG